MYFLFLFVFLAVAAVGQKLTFRSDGTFKIVQFTDTHYHLGNPKADIALENIAQTLDVEKPDLVVFTGDVVTSAPAKEGWDNITSYVISRKIPFAVALGNHDDEAGITRRDLEKLITGYPYCLNYPTSGRLSGSMNNVIPVYKGNSIHRLVYLFDSMAYSTIRGVDGYGWIPSDVVEWYRGQSQHYALLNGHDPVPSLAFFHIPLPEFREAYANIFNKRAGQRWEPEDAPDLNSGMFLAMREQGDVMATFVGHDHVNDYIVGYKGMALGYGCFSGGSTTYTPMINGARIIILKEGSRSFDTYVRVHDNSIRFRVTYPNDLTSDPNDYTIVKSRMF